MLHIIKQALRNKKILFALNVLEVIFVIICFMLRINAGNTASLGVIASIPYSNIVYTNVGLIPVNVYAAPYVKETQSLSAEGLLGDLDLGDKTVVGLYLDDSYYCAVTTETVRQLQQYFKVKLREVQTIDSDIIDVIYDKKIKFGALSADFDTAYVKTADEIIARFESDTLAYKTYEIKPNDTLGTIAKDLGITIADLKGYNCKYNNDDVYNWYDNTLIVGSKIQVPYTQPYMNLQYCKQTEDLQFIPYETVEIYDDTMYDDELIVMTQGEYGTESRTMYTTFTLSGTMVSQEVLSTKTLSEPVTCITKVGTKMRVQKADYTKETPKGSYVYPVEYADSYISAYLGDGRGHKGVDIAAPYGTPIYAAMGGTVTRAATGWNGGYGVCIEIDNTDDMNCRYAHLSYLAVSEGDEVVKGQLIGYVGNTGDSQGNHLHFEVYTKDGVLKNPMTYIHIPE